MTTDSDLPEGWPFMPGVQGRNWNQATWEAFPWPLADAGEEGDDA